MSPEAQRIAIAEACGWKTDGMGWWFNEGAQNPMDSAVGRVVLPDYLNDLNAMHEVEKTLTECQRREYFFHLFGGQRLDDGDLWKAVHATAAHRAEAFLRTLGKWSTPTPETP